MKREDATRHFFAQVGTAELFDYVCVALERGRQDVGSARALYLDEAAAALDALRVRFPVPDTMAEAAP